MQSMEELVVGEVGHWKGSAIGVGNEEVGHQRAGCSKKPNVGASADVILLHFSIYDVLALR